MLSSITPDPAPVEITPLDTPSEVADLAADAAVQRLEEARRDGDTFEAMAEILSDLIGCASFGVFSLESGASVFSLKAGTGGALQRRLIPVRLGAVRQAGALHAFPVRRDGELAGAIMLFSLPPGKESVDVVDKAVLGVVAEAAAESLLDRQIAC